MLHVIRPGIVWLHKKCDHSMFTKFDPIRTTMHVRLELIMDLAQLVCKMHF